MLRELTSTTMILHWTKMLTVFILFENVKGWNSSSETHITSLFFGKTLYEVINISPRVKAIRVENINATNSFGVIFYHDRNSEAAHNFVTFPPEKPFDFRCETEDMRLVYCSWKIQRAPNLTGDRRRKYTLLISDSKAVGCDVENTDHPSCGFDVIQQQITYNTTLLVTNSLGQASETYIFNITDREPLVTIDLWRQIRDHPNRTVTLLWKTDTLKQEFYMNLKSTGVALTDIDAMRNRSDTLKNRVTSYSQWTILAASPGWSVVLRRTGRTLFSWQHAHLQAVDRKPPPSSEPERTASEKIHTLMIEDCKWCDVEILDVRPITTEKPWLTGAEDQSCSFITPEVTPPSCHLTTDLTNFTYVSCVQQDLPSEELQTEATKQESEISGFSSDYVTSVGT
ncbi:hypothetical protein cypCar_00031653 [Cyprinus carpio]|nr:hypothetical protein cypCar_00031653 [Cyprinus carpio]